MLPSKEAVSEITGLVAAELSAPTWAATQQYLEVLTPEQENGHPAIVRIEFNAIEQRTTAYVKVKGEEFYLALDFELTDSIELVGIDTIPFVSISFSPRSDELTIEQLANLTTIHPTELMRKGTYFVFGKSRMRYSYNGLRFSAPLIPERFSTKLENFLSVLEADVSGIQALSNATGCDHLFIDVTHHIGNTNFTGLFLDKAIVARLSKLGLGVTFDLYATGNLIE